MKAIKVAKELTKIVVALGATAITSALVQAVMPPQARMITKISVYAAQIFLAKAIAEHAVAQVDPTFEKVEALIDNPPAILSV